MWEKISIPPPEIAQRYGLEWLSVNGGLLVDAKSRQGSGQALGCATWLPKHIGVMRSQKKEVVLTTPAGKLMTRLVLEMRTRRRWSLTQTFGMAAVPRRR